MRGPYYIKRRKIGEILVSKGKLSPEQLADLLRQQQENPKPLGQLMLAKGIITKQELEETLGEQLGIPHVWLRKGMIDPRIVHLLPKEKALHYQVVPMFVVKGAMTLATADPHAYFVFDEIEHLTQLKVQPVLCRTDDITEAIQQAYQDDIAIGDVMKEIESSELDLVESNVEQDIAHIAEMAEGSPVINLVNHILLRGIREGASDIHIEAQSDRMRVRLRIDGMLYELKSHPFELLPAVVSRLKVMASLDISERRRPQDGRIQVQLDGRKIDLRFSSMPGIHGEKVVLRILDRSTTILDINKLGLETRVLKHFKQLLRRPHGLILVCGPTGSGKTTTLYSAITMLNITERNIITIEDPVEYHLNNVNQNQVNAEIGLGFATFLRHALRQDPDIIMVGEIRDRATAEIAIQASLTGHLVLSTIHTNDSPSVITRLLEIGVEPFLLASSLVACMAQRLARKICPACKLPFYASKEIFTELGLDQGKQIRLYKGKGCPECFDSGYKGRIGIYELLTIDETLQSLMLTGSSRDAIRAHCSGNGFRTLKRDGYDKVLQHETTIEEIQRVTALDG
jgi:type IV pilus assembly protein PilB